MIESKPLQKPQKSSHKSPSKKKAGKTSTDFQSELKSMDDKWSEPFSRLVARSFQVPVEPVQKSDVVVTDRPFIPPVQQPTGVTGQKGVFWCSRPEGSEESHPAC